MADVTVILDAAGTIGSIDASIGDMVAADDIILIIETADSEIPVEAGADGVILEILVKEGEAVEEGDEAAVIEED